MAHLWYVLPALASLYCLSLIGSFQTMQALFAGLARKRSLDRGNLSKSCKLETSMSLIFHRNSNSLQKVSLIKGPL